MTRLESRRLVADILRRGQTMGRSRRWRLRLVLKYYWPRQDELRTTRERRVSPPEQVDLNGTPGAGRRVVVGEIAQARLW